MKRVQICGIASLPEGEMQFYQVGYNYDILFYNNGSQIFAFDRWCPGQNIPFDNKNSATVENDFITVTNLNIIYDLRTGRPQSVKNRSSALGIYRVDVVADEVFVWVPEDYMFGY